MAIHPTAIVSAHADLDPSVEVGPYAIIEAHVRIGPHTRVMAHAHLSGHTTIGRENLIHMGAILGHEPQDLKFKAGTRSYLRVGDRNVFREYSSVHRGTEAESATVIGNDCYLMGQAHVGHNCVVGNGVILCNGALLAGHVHIGDRVFLSGCAMVHQFMHVGRLAMISGGSRITMDLPPFLLAAERNEIHSINLVGLQRAGLGAAAIGQIKALYKLFYRSGLNNSQALAAAAQNGGFGTAEAQCFLEFVRNSRNGICQSAARVEKRSR